MTPEIAPALSRRSLGTALLLLLGGTLALAAARLRAPDGCIGAPIDPGLGPTATSDGGVSVTTRLDRTAVLEGGDGLVRMELVLGAEDRPGRDERVPTDLVVILDRSGSMEGGKIADARRAVLDLAGALGPADRFALVSYSNDARVDHALSRLDGGARETLDAVVRRVAASGGTNMSSGLDVALGLVSESAGRATRVVLLSDGLANQGDASLDGLCGRGRSLARREGVLSTVGIGLDFNEILMTRLADAGTGNFYFLADATALDAVLRGELRSAALTVASGLSVTLHPAPGVEVVDAAGFPLERGDGSVTFRPGALFAGQERRTWITWRVPVTGDASPLGSLDVAWSDGGRPARVQLATLGSIAVVHRQEDAVASLDKDAWREGLANEAFQAMRQRVAAAVAAGRAEKAAAEVDGFLSAAAPAAAAVGDREVLGKLEEAKALRDQAVRAASAPTESERKDFAKREWAEAQDERRAGAKADPATGR